MTLTYYLIDSHLVRLIKDETKPLITMNYNLMVTHVIVVKGLRFQLYYLKNSQYPNIKNVRFNEIY
jgi:hypothetical protein